MTDYQKIIFFTQGCRTNQAETSALKNLCLKNGYTISTKIAQADLAIINTCTVTHKADRDLRLLINKINSQNPKIKIILTGCQTVFNSDALSKQKNILNIYSNTDKFNIFNNLPNFSSASNPNQNPESEQLNFSLPFNSIENDRTRVNVKIQDGCNNFCSFCLVPLVRGRTRSRYFQEIITEITQLSQNKVKEIILTGINLGNYDDNGQKLPELLKSLVQISNLGRLRISSLELNTLTPELISLIAQNEKICKFLHIPIQSGSDPILKAMKRKYTVNQFSQKILQLKKLMPNLGLGTDVITGFPGETEKDFENTYNLLSDLPFSYFHVFSYSDRPNTPSINLPNKISPALIQTRTNLLRKLSEEKKKQFALSQLNSQQTVLFEVKKNGLWQGLTENYLKTEVASNLNLKNQTYQVKITDVLNQNLLGELIERA